MDVERALREVFGLAELRPGQREVIESVLAGHPTLAVMPTGAGKSLLYQLPAVVAEGTAIVVSPLIALMKDQVDALRARGVAAAAITSALAPHEVATRLEKLEAGALSLIYVAPERFRSSRFTDALGRAAPHLSLFAVDEAHCISAWGHDFRPDYLRLGPVVAHLRPRRLLAVTATATPKVQKDIVQELGFQKPAVFVRGFDRPNLRFFVEEVDRFSEKRARLSSLIVQRGNGGAVLVYAATRRNAEAYGDHLLGSGVRAAVYHAGLDDDQRTGIQDAFTSGRLHVVVATPAFGMGVDVKQVRLVIHADMPRSPETYYQEAGRGGRDGAPADAVLLFHWRDYHLQEFLIEASLPSPERMRAVWRALRENPWCGTDRPALARTAGIRRDASFEAALSYLARFGYVRDHDGVLEAIRPGEQEPGTQAPFPIDAQALESRAQLERERLDKMVAYTQASSCRRRFLLEYFGDADAATAACAACDRCLGARRPLAAKELTRVNTALVVVDRLGGRFGRARVAANLAGMGEKRADTPSGGRLGAFGAAYCLALLAALENAGLIESWLADHPRITDAGRRVLEGKTAPQVSLPPEPQSERRRQVATVRLPMPAAAPLDPVLLGRLREFRDQAASRQRLPACFVLANHTLDALARERPRDLSALTAIPGLGPAKIAKYGPGLLAIIASVPLTDGPSATSDATPPVAELGADLPCASRGNHLKPQTFAKAARRS